VCFLDPAAPADAPVGGGSRKGGRMGPAPSPLQEDGSPVSRSAAGRLHRRAPSPVRGLGDLPFLGVFPAYAAAIAQATGCYVDQIPTLPESIQTCLEPE